MSWLSRGLGIDRRRNQAREQQAQNAADPYSRDNLWTNVGRQTTADQQRADEAYGAYGARDQEYGDAITSAGAFNPSATQGVDFSTQAAWTPSNLAGVNTSDLRGFDSTASRGVNTSQLRGYQPTNLNAFSTGALGSFDSKSLGAFDPTVHASTGNLAAFNNDEYRNYDPTQAVGQYARGAWNAIQPDLADQLDSVRNQDARLGRLDTGWFDKDRGQVMTRAVNSVNAGIDQQAVNAAGLRAGVLQGAYGQLLDRANDTDTLGTQAAIESGKLGLERAQGIDANRLSALDRSTGYDLQRAGQADTLGYNALNAATGYDTDLAQSMDANRLNAMDRATGYDVTRAGQMDTLTNQNNQWLGNAALQRANYLDTSRQNAGQFAASQAGQRASNAQQLYAGQTGLAHDSAFGMLDQDTASRNAQAARRNNRTQSWLSGLGAAGSTVAGLI